MTKLMRIGGTVLMVASCVLAGCGGTSPESDAKRLAALMCKAQKLAERAASGDSSVMEESSRLMTEAQTLKTQLERRYTADADKAKLATALMNAMGNCP